MGRGELKQSFQVLEEYKWEMGQAKCRGKSFLVTGNISYLVRYISNLVISIYVGIYQEIQPVHSEGDQPWDFIGRTDAKAETPILWPPHAKS